MLEGQMRTPYFPVNFEDAPARRGFAQVTSERVKIGDVSVTPSFAGLTPGYAGVYQVNVQLPLNLPTKIYPLRVTAKGSSSDTQSVQVGSRNP